MAHACGKVILCGEHAVVYGVPAIAAGIERGVEAKASHSDGDRLLVDERVIHREESLGRAFRALLECLGAQGVTVQATSSLPSSVGLGASAALGVAIARAVAALVPSVDDSALLLATSAWEGVFHGNPSGIDAACALSGGCIRFERDRGFRPMRLARDLPLAVAVAGAPSSTKSMVESVAQYKARKPELFEANLRAIETLVKNAEHALAAGDHAGLGRLLDYNHMLLASWLLSTQELEVACRLAREGGALGAKLTGAGGGGCVIAVCDDGPQGGSAATPDDRLGAAAEPILERWRAEGIECFATTVRAFTGEEIRRDR